MRKKKRASRAPRKRVESTLNDAPWTVEQYPFPTRNGRRTQGTCCQATRTIKIDSRQSGEQELDTILHELWHAMDWSKDESWVGKRAREGARLLTLWGYELKKVKAKG